MADEKTAEKRISIGKIYLKDFSFESPQAPEVFRRPEWRPKTDLNLSSSHTELGEDQHEVVLSSTVTAKSEGDEEEKTLFVVELQQAGIFQISGYDGEELSHIIGSFCPNTLFPYARETLATLIMKGGFPEFILQPINFDALWRQGFTDEEAAPVEEAAKH